MSKPKEFYVFMARSPGIKEWHLSAETVTNHPDQKLLMEGIADSIHVIEYSAYKELKEEVDRMSQIILDKGTVDAIKHKL